MGLPVAAVLESVFVCMCMHMDACMCVCLLLVTFTKPLCIKSSTVLSLLAVLLWEGEADGPPNLIALHKTTWMNNLSVIKVIIIE